MIKFDAKLLEGRTIEQLDERFFRLNQQDEIVLTPFAEDKIAKAMKAFYGKKLKELSLANNNLQFLSQSKDMKAIKDDQATEQLAEEYARKYADLNAEYEKMQADYKRSHDSEFEWVDVVDPASVKDDDGKYVSEGGSLYGLTCTNLQEAAIGYQTASAYLKANNDSSSFPTIRQYQAKDMNKWKAELAKMRETLLAKYPDVPRDVFSPIVYMPNNDYTYTINWHATQKLAADDSLMSEAADEYIRTMLEAR